jgi:hypothetical protein
MKTEILPKFIATYDEDSKSGSGTEASQRKVKGTIHWVSIKDAIRSRSSNLRPIIYTRKS